MADEVTPADPVDAMWQSHFAKMQEIGTTGLAKSQELCDQSLVDIKKHSGLRSRIVNQALEKIGITDLSETETA